MRRGALNCSRKWHEFGAEESKQPLLSIFDPVLRERLVTSRSASSAQAASAGSSSGSGNSGGGVSGVEDVVSLILFTDNKVLGNIAPLVVLILFCWARDNWEDREQARRDAASNNCSCYVLDHGTREVRRTGCLRSAGAWDKT